MKFQFTESDYAAPFQFGGRLAITAENAGEVESLIDHFRLFRDLSNVDTLQARIAALQSETLTHVIGTDKRPMYETGGTLGAEFLKPYKDWAARNFGYRGPFPDLEIPRKWGGLIHTNYQSRIWIEFESICYESFVSAEPWGRFKLAQDRADHLARDYIAEEFGMRRLEPEYIDAGRGLMRRNPDYLKRHAATPAASNARLKRAFFDWWKVECATEEQRNIIAGNEAIAANAAYMSAFDFSRDQHTIHHAKTAKNYESVSFAQFAAMSN